ncbi:MAG: hypothetical protein JSW06_10390 [Thermoplasmatales archaeon]|nr:MAG: hypothetical protein JSW06_10390 [Thermoplasmatales archaeon]
MDIDGSEGDSDTTGSNGIAYLTAPDVTDDVEININAFKGGYFVGSTTIRAENVPESIFMDSLTPIIAAVLVLMFAILFVRFRKELPKPTIEIKADSPEKSIKNKKENITNKTNQIKTPSDAKAKEKLPLSEKEPRVEEIRIQRSEKKKEIKYVVEEETEKVISNHKKDEYEWFKGKDHMKYKINELTGEIEEQMEDKWFEGVYDIKSQVDKKLKKSSKKNKSK